MSFSTTTPVPTNPQRREMMVVTDRLRALGLVTAWFLLALVPVAASAATVVSSKPSVVKPRAVKPAAPQRVKLIIRAGLHNGFGRLVFATPAGQPAVPVVTTGENGRLTVRFARPVSFSTGDLADRLEGYLSQARLSADGLTLTGTLERPVSVHATLDDPQTMLIDMADARSPRQNFAAPPPAPAVRAAGVPLVLKVGEHGSFDRLVFQAAKPVTAQLSQGDGRAVLRFDRPAHLDLERGNAALPAPLRPLRLDSDGRDVGFSLPPGWRAALTRSGRKFIVDAIKGTPPKPREPIVKPLPAAAPIIAAESPVTKPLGAVPQAQPTTPIQATALAAVPVPPAKAPVIAPPSAAATAAITAGLIAASTDQNEAGLDEGSAAESNIGGSFGSNAGLRLIWSLAGDGLTLRFEWPQPVSAAVFRRGGAVWIVFDQQATLDLSRFQSQNLPVVTAIDQMPITGGTALHLSVWAGFNPSVERAGNTWIIDLKSGPTHPEAPVQPRLEDANDGTSLVFPVLDPSQPLTLQDADNDEQLVVVPLPELGQGIDSQLAIPDLRVLASNQGIVMRPISDALTVRSDEQDVTVTAPGGLLVSTEVDRTAVRKSAIGKHEALIDFPAWGGKIVTGDDLFKMRQSLQHAILDADQPSKTAARTDLAKFYIANGLGAEALGVLAAIETDDPEAFDDPQLRAIRAVAAEMMDRPKNTLADLQDKVFDTAPDALLWRAAASADLQDWNAAADGYTKAAGRLSNYPPLIRRRLDLKFAEALLDARPTATGDAFDQALADNRTRAQALIDDVMANAPTEGESDAAKVLTGRILGVEGDADRAQALWQEVSNSPLSSLARAEAGYALILSKYDAGTMTRLDAIEALDRMRFDWRGDDFEVRLLRKMGELQYEDADYHGALDAFRRILTDFPASPYIPEIAAEMQRDFTSMFVGPKADTVPPVAALAVFQEFKILTPPGAVGDAVARNLIDRLVSIDLMDRAAGALYQEVTTRLTGLAQARGTTELALLELLQGKPVEAQKALALPIDQTQLTPTLARERQEFGASAAFMGGDRDRALALLSGDDSADADVLRADIYWANHDWKSVARLLTSRLPPPGPDVVLDDQQAAMAINAATAMSLSGDQDGLAALKQNYGAAMAATSLKDDFATLVGSGVPDPSSLSNFGAQVAGSRSFIETYRQRLATGRLSTVLGG